MTNKAPTRHTQTLKKHSEAKLDFWQLYLTRYLSVMLNIDYISCINIYDAYCGPGLYNGDGKGSPIRTVDTAIELTEKFDDSASRRLNLHFNDKKKRILELQSALSKYDLTTVKFNIETSHDDGLEFLEKVHSAIVRQNSTVKNLILIDPWGYKGLTKVLLDKLLSNGRTEIFLFSPISHIQRFIGPAKDSEEVFFKPLQELLRSFFDSKHNIWSKLPSRFELIEYLTEALKYGDKYYAKSLRITSDVKGQIFALFFVTPHIYGLEKALEALFLIDPRYGKTWEQPSGTESLFADEELLEESERNLVKLRGLILQAVSESRTNVQLYEITVTNSYLPKHARKVLADLVKRRVVIVTYNSGEVRKANSFYIAYEHYSKNEVLAVFSLASRGHESK